MANLWKSLDTTKLTVYYHLCKTYSS